MMFEDEDGLEKCVIRFSGAVRDCLPCVGLVCKVACDTCEKDMGGCR